MSLPTSEIICIDYETIELLPDGSTRACANYWQDNFRVLSCAFSWYNDLGIKQSLFIQGEAEVGKILRTIADNQTRVLMFNYQFELGVTTCRYPDLSLNWYCDVMRLAQLYDNGGGHDSFDMVLIDDDVTEDIDTDEDEERKPKKPKYKRVALAGFGLSKCSRRIIGALEDHKAEAHGWIYANIPDCPKGKAGRYLDRLPLDILERYNIADTETTLDLYEFITTQFTIQEFDWTTDHNLYMPSVKRIVASEIRGIPVNRPDLATFHKETTQEITNIGTKFRADFAKEIRAIEFRRTIHWILSPKTPRGQRNRYKKWSTTHIPKLVFNPGSNKQLAALFKDTLGIHPIFFTPKEAPSFKSAHLHQWGDGGQILLKRRKRLIVQKQSEAILEQSARDGRLHIKLKAVGTKTGRYSGTGGVNIQALSRREKALMDKLLPDPGYIFVSSDASAGEPSVITHYTKDKNYRYFCFDGIGKEPYYDGKQMMIGDVYLGYASACPLFAKDMRHHFDTALFDGRTFAEQWVLDADVVKEFKPIKFIRKNAKWMCLAADNLIAVKDKGYIPIDKITASDIIWDGDAWVTTEGCIDKGYAEVITLQGAYLTKDHKVLTSEGWENAEHVKTLETKRPPAHSWLDVWAMAGRVFRSKEVRRIPLYLCQLWWRM